jgi:hypothetical protein
MLSVIMLSVVMLTVVMLTVVMLSVVAPIGKLFFWWFVRFFFGRKNKLAALNRMKMQHVFSTRGWCLEFLPR